MSGLNPVAAVFRVFNTYLPKDKPRCIPMVYDFTTSTGSQSQFVGLDEMNEQGLMGFCQGVFVDNRLGTAPVVLTLAGATQQVIAWPAGAQGYLPIMANSMKGAIISCAGTQTANTLVLFYNIIMQPQLWFPNQAPIGDNVVDGIGNDIMLFNNTEWDRARNNCAITGLTLTAQGAGTVNQAGQYNYNFRFLTITANITTNSLSVGCVVSLQMLDTVSGQWISLGSLSNIAGTGVSFAQFGPGLPSSAGASYNVAIGRSVRLSATCTGTGSITGTIGIQGSV